MKKTIKVFASVTKKGKVFDCSTHRGWVDTSGCDLVIPATLTVDLPEKKEAKKPRK